MLPRDHTPCVFFRLLTCSLLSVLLSVLLSSCVETVACNDMASPAVRLTLVNGQDFEGKCAYVAITDGSFHEEAMCSAVDADCLCTGAFERAGRYTIDVVRSDGETAHGSVTAHSGKCGVETAEITLTLPPAPSHF